jgi:hypothetical protein
VARPESWSEPSRNVVTRRSGKPRLEGVWRVWIETRWKQDGAALWKSCEKSFWNELLFV